VAEHQQQTARDCLGVFAKYWEPGKVKTRLAKSLGDVKAAKIYEAFVAATIARLSAVDAQRILAYSPADEKTHAAFSTAEIDGWSLVAQAEGDLGTRIAEFFERQFQAGAKRVVLLGTDSPNVPLVEVQEAFEHLETSEVVLGPTEDGGYYLVGAARKVPPIFTEIPWSTAEVLPTTIDRLERAGASYTQLDPWYDVDEIFDLHRLIEDLQEKEESEPALGLLLQHIMKTVEA